MNRPFGWAVIRFKCNNCGTIFESTKEEFLNTDEVGRRQLMKTLPELWWYHVCEEGKQYGSATAVGIRIKEE
jgi:hypothetical protein